MEKEAKSSFE
jgi:hypothetical protein